MYNLNEKRAFDIIVSKNNDGQFSKIQEAIDSIPERHGKETAIFIRKGVYREKVFIDKPGITLIGEDPLDTVIEYGDYAKMTDINGEEIKTFRTYTFFTGGRDFTAENITFINSAGKGDIVGQAVAVYVDGDRSRFFNCRFIGNQDTLFTGPLPPKPLTVNTFGGPRDGMSRLMSRQYYKDCYIQGDIDFIFGSATAFFDNCEIYSNSLKSGENSYITAPSTPENDKYGYVFINCRLTGDATPKSVYLGRPWRNFGKAAYINCHMGPHIIPPGWDDWNKYEARATVDFAEFNSTGPGGYMEQRVKWAHILTREAAVEFTKENVLSGSDGWKP